MSTSVHDRRQLLTSAIDLADYPEVAKYLRGLQFGTLEHTNTYNALRQSQEGFHGYAKDQGYEKLDAAGLRRVHGLAALTGELLRELTIDLDKDYQPLKWPRSEPTAWVRILQMS